MTVYRNGPDITTNKGNNTKHGNSTQWIEKSQEGSAFIKQDIFDPEEISAKEAETRIGLGRGDRGAEEVQQASPVEVELGKKFEWTMQNT